MNAENLYDSLIETCKQLKEIVKNSNESEDTKKKLFGNLVYIQAMVLFKESISMSYLGALSDLPMLDKFVDIKTEQRRRKKKKRR